MYSIYSKVGDHKVCLHDNTVSNSEVKVINPVLTLEDNAAGSLSFSLAPGNNAYEKHTFYEEMATGFTDISSTDLSQAFESGAIDGTGHNTNSDHVIRTSLSYLIPENTASISMNAVSNVGHHDMMNDLSTGSDDDPQDSTRLISDFYEFFSGSDTFIFDGSVVRLEEELIEEFNQGAIGDPLSTLSNITRICTGSLQCSKSITVDMTVVPDGDWEYTVYGYGFGGNDNLIFLGSTGWIDISKDVTFSPSISQPAPAPSIVMERYRIMIRNKSDSGIAISYFDSIKNVVSRYLQWRIIFYDENYEKIDETDFIEADKKIVHTPVSGSIYYRIELRFHDDRDIDVTDLASASIRMDESLLWSVYGYDIEGNYIGTTGWTPVDRDHTLSVSTSNYKKIRVTIECSSAIKMGPNDVSNPSIVFRQLLTTRVPKTVDMVSRMKSTITVYRKEWYLDQATQTKKWKEVEIWEGRVLSEDKDFWNNRSIYCEGELSYLNDTCQPQREYTDVTLRQFLEAVFNYHNSRVSDDKKFYVGQIWVSDTASTYSSVTSRTTQFEKTMEVINKLISDYGGHIKIRKSGGKRYLDWFDDYGQDNNPTQTVNFGVNLLDFTCNWDMSELCTVLLPTGKVIQQGGTSCAGDPLPLNGGAGPTPCQLLYQDRNTREVFIQSNPSLGGYKTAVAVVEPGKNYYFSGRLHGGFVAYTIKSNADGSGDYYDGGTKTAGTEGQVGFVDFIDQKITIPAGAHSVVMCSFGDDIPLTLKNEIEAKEGLDTYLTIEECAYDAGWHQQGSAYIVNQEAVAQFGWIEKQLALDDVEDKDLLYQTAKIYLQSGQFDKMVIELTAIDMNLLGAKTDYINILDQVRVISAPHGLDRYLPVTKLEIPLDRPEDQKYTLGDETKQSLTEVNNEINSELLNKLFSLPTMSETLNSAKANSAEMINNALSGYITMKRSEDDGHAVELIISDKQNYMDPTAKVGRWNSAGLAYSNAGYDLNQFNTQVAITADGVINANRILAGVLAGITIQGCNIIAGGLDNVDGTILVKSGGSETHAIKLEHGTINFGDLSSNTFTKHSDIKGDIIYTTQSGDVHGVRVKTPVFAIDADELWVSSTSAGSDGRGGVNHNFIVKDNNGANVALEFRKGILISAQVQQ